MVLLAVGLVSSLAELPAELAWLAGADDAVDAEAVSVCEALEAEAVVACEALEAGVDGLSAAEVGLLPADELGFTPASLSGGVILTLHRQFGRR